MDHQLLTIGHGTFNGLELVELLQRVGVESLVDVRRFPASRHNPDVRREALPESLPAAGIAYRWDERLGGRRRLPADAFALDPWWRVESFRAYAAHTRTADFGLAMSELLAETAERLTVVMCSESVWWRCHRRLIADVARLGHGVTVQHVMPTGKLVAHQASAGARVDADGHVVWDRT